MPRSVLSKFATVTPLAEAMVIRHAITGERVAVTLELGRLVSSLRGTAFSREEVAEQAGAAADQLLGLLRSRRLVVDEDTEATRRGLEKDPICRGPATAEYDGDEVRDRVGIERTFSQGGHIAFPYQ